MNHEKHEIHQKLILPDEVFRIQGAVFDVYRTMGAGFLEAVYHECLVVELGLRQVPFRSRQPLSLAYKGRALQQTYCPDIVCYGQIILELKAVRTLAPEHRAQAINYLRASGLPLALLINFGTTPRVQIERFAL